MKNRGFTFVETVIVMGIMAILMGITTISLLKTQRRTNLNEVVEILIADLRSQQAKAMTGVVEGGVVPAGFGIHFETNRYVLFSGPSYNPSSNTNAPVVVASPNEFRTIGFSANTIIFANGSGEITGFTPGSDSVTLAGEGDQTKTIQVNAYGVVVGVD